LLLLHCGAGIFRDRDSAERAYQSSMARGYSDSDINLAMSEDTRRRYFSDAVQTELGSKATEGAGVGGAVGATVGAIAAAIAAMGLRSSYRGWASSSRVPPPPLLQGPAPAALQAA
jgi:hypothetical protein